jgi:hypothetical protein
MFYSSLAQKEEHETSSLRGSKMSIRILRHERLPWYTKKDGKLIRMSNRGSQINRIMKRNGMPSINYQRGGQLTRKYQRDRQLSRKYLTDGEQFKIKNLKKIICYGSGQTNTAHPTTFMVCMFFVFLCHP